MDGDAPLAGAPATPVFVPTADGARLALKRRGGSGTPVILLHGIACNADHWNLPPIKGPDYEFRSLATQLVERGYDAWLVNLRGYGDDTLQSTPAPGQDDWCVDHFVLYDVPAVVEHVRAETGQRPFLLGASMGAMTLGGYVQGTRRIEADDAAAPAPADDDAPEPAALARHRIVADAALAQQRAAGLAGAVFVEFPAALRWPSSLRDETGRLRWDELLRSLRQPRDDANYPFELLSQLAWVEALVAALGEVPLDRFRPGSREPWWMSLPAPVASRIDAARTEVARRLLKLSARFTGAEQMRPEILLEGHRHVINQMKAGVLRQMAKSVRARGFVSLLGTPDHVYSDHYRGVQVPTLVVAGGRDRIAHPDVTREVFFDAISAADKQFRHYPDYAHGEFQVVPQACSEVYPDILAWLDDRRA